MELPEQVFFLFIYFNSPLFNTTLQGFIYTRQGVQQEQEV